jgi:benzoate membrane transport protein
MRKFAADISVSAVVAGLIVVLVGFTSTVAIVFQAARTVGANPAEIASWIWALGMGMGLSCIGLSLYYKSPVVTAWSTPGAALICTTQGFDLASATGAFILCAIAICIAGFSGAFERMMRRIPMAIACAMLAGLLLRFGIGAFSALAAAPGLVLTMLGAHLLGRRVWPRYAVLGVLAAGLVFTYVAGQLDFSGVHLSVATPVWVRPQFSLTAAIGLALPLFVVTMTSQNAPGVAAIRAAGYQTPISPLIATTGVLTLLLAPFGGFALNLAAITAAIAMSPEAHPEPSKRYIAGVSAGFFYLLTGVFGAAIGNLFAAIPATLLAVLAGLALLGTIGNNLTAALRTESEPEREAAFIAFLITASNVVIYGIGSAFWGLVGGLVALWCLRTGRV